VNLNVSEIQLVIAELAPQWQGTRLQKIHLRGPQVALLSLQGPGRKGVLVLSVAPDQAGLYLTPQRGPADGEASAFCMLLRRWLKGTPLLNLSCLGDDRIVVIQGAPGRGQLVAEMFGTGRLVLCDDQQRVLAWSPPAARRAELVKGEAYQPPPRPGPAAAAPASRLRPGQANEDAESLCNVEPPDENLTTITRWLRGQLRRQKRLVQKVEGDVERGRQRQGATHHGELAKLHLAELRRGMDQIEVVNLFEPGEPLVTIPLDPRLSPVDNLQRLFAQGRKGRRAAEVAQQRLAEARQRLQGLEELAERAKLTPPPTDLEKAARQLGYRPRQDAPRPVPGTSGRRRLPYREYRDGRDRPLLVGRSGADNDSLTLKVARPHDLWLHVRGYPGSHVVVPLNRNEVVGEQRLLDAATLAAHFSEARREATVEVTYTPRRYVQKPRGAASGKVLLLREKVILLTMEPDRLQRLLASRVDI
jgi:predicted ribosome quality control (RQC) complex YloA/Tae2 family protein